MTTTLKNTSTDIPPSAALLALGTLVGGLIYIESPTAFQTTLSQLDAYFEEHSTFITITFFTLTLNLIFIFSVAARTFGINRQGKRLEILLGRAARPTRAITRFDLVPLLAVLVVVVFLAKIQFPLLEQVPPILRSESLSPFFNWGIRINYAMAVYLFLVLVTSVPKYLGFSIFAKRSLPPFPRPKNSLVLGSIYDDSPEHNPQWVISSQKALTGNVLSTASIGGGKSQGVILTYFEQVLSNFDPRPSILAIDPKGTFIPEALKVVKRLGLEKDTLHMRLGGNVTFNPIFDPRPLKGGRFLEIAQMIRASALNFMGRNSDSPFWEVSAFNLIKNTLALCAARGDENGLSLNQLYSELVLATQRPKEIISYLEESSLDTAIFDAEERFNLERAAKYFEEYSQLDEKVKTGVQATATAFLNQFQEYQASQIFCPPQGQATIQSMDEVVDGGKILLFDIPSPALAKSMGTFVKLHYEQSVLNRLTSSERGRERSAVLLIDEYQDVASSGGGQTLGDDRFLAKSREANAISIVAMQSLASLKNSLGKESSSRELIQNFRTIIAGHSSDLDTIQNFKELVGQEDRKKTTHSVSENAQHPSRNLMLGGFEVKDANISESISTSEHREFSVTGREFSRLASFTCFAFIFDGIETQFRKLFLKPYFLKKKNILNSELIKSIKKGLAAASLLLFTHSSAFAFPDVCTVIKSTEFRSCLGFSVSSCMCGWPVPRPCARFTYYVPQTFIEVFPHAKNSHFADLPGVATQLAEVGRLPIPFGAEADDETQSFQAHAIAVPLAILPFSTLPCQGARLDRSCFDAMSEHLGSHWNTGSGDLLQPNRLAWGISPKACLLKGAATSMTGEPEAGNPAVHSGCSTPMDWMKVFPPSPHSACNGWGIFYPRSGTYLGASQTAGALMIASRMKSLGNEVFRTTPHDVDELWQMISPQSSSCFREGQNIGVLETLKNVRELARLSSGKLNGYLFTTWSKVSCCRDLPLVPAAYAAIEAISLACQGKGTP